MDFPAETVKGEVPVIMKLSVGSEHLDLLFTESRLIVARLGKRGATSTASLPIWAALSGAIDGLFKRRKESSKMKAASTLSPERILASDKENFPVPYDQVVAVELTVTEFGRTEIMILTRDDKFNFSTGLSTEKVLALFRAALASKLSIKKGSN